MVQSLEALLADGQGDTNWPAIYQCLKTPLWYAAARGARRAGVRDREAIAEAVQQAFGEFMNLDFTKVEAPERIARTIAYRRGLDRGIAARQRWNREAAMEVLPADRLRAEPGQPPGYTASAEEAFFSVEELGRQEGLWERALRCLESLGARQRMVVRENVMKGRTLTDIGGELGISHTAVRKHREKGLELLRRCVGREQPSPSIRTPRSGGDPVGGSDEDTGEGER
jgi:DNA-directed RNA polymerase specialized sigma24 family protein